MSLKNSYYKLLAKITGKNSKDTPVDVILEQLHEPRPLPMGRSEWNEWSNRIIAGAAIDGGAEDKQVFEDSQRYALANMLLHLGPTESFKPDAFFIHSLRKFAVNQVADSIRKELFESAKERTAKEEAAKATAEQLASQEQAEATLARAKAQAEAQGN